MKLRHLTLENYRGAPDGAYSFAHPATGAPLDYVLITGGPCSGKTSMLEAIGAAKESYGPYGGRPSAADALRSGASRGRLEATWELSEDERREARSEAQVTIPWHFGPGAPRDDRDIYLQRFLSTYSEAPDRGKLEYFPAHRRLASRTPRAPSPAVPALVGPPASQARLRLARDPDKYAGLEAVLVARATQDALEATARLGEQGVLLKSQQPDSLGPVRESIAALLPDLRLVGIELSVGARVVRFRRRDRIDLALGDLSEFEQQGVLFALAFVLLGLNRSVVLIDHPEHHVHPSRVVAFFSALCGLGRGNQIIATTSSPSCWPRHRESTCSDWKGRGHEAAARAGDHQQCWKVDSDFHKGGPIEEPCCPTVHAEQHAQARVGDLAFCTYAHACLSQGVAMVLVGGLPASTVDHRTTHQGVVRAGASLVFIGGPSVTLVILDENDEEFRKALQDAWAKLFNTPSGVEWLKQMAATGRTVRFKRGKDPNSYCKADDVFDDRNGTGTNATVEWNPYDMDPDDPEAPPEIGLAHEMVHALHDAKGTVGDGPYERIPGQKMWLNREEERSTAGTSGPVRKPGGTYEPNPKDYSKNVPTENSFRRDMGIPPRRTYYPSSWKGGPPW